MNHMPKNLMIAAAVMAASWTMTESANAQYCGSTRAVYSTAPVYYAPAYTPVVQVVQRPVVVTRPRYYRTYQPVYYAPRRARGFSINFNYSSRDRHHGHHYRRGHSRRDISFSYDYRGKRHHRRHYRRY